jgi:hypothetical protein
MFLCDMASSSACHTFIWILPFFLTRLSTPRQRLYCTSSLLYSSRILEPAAHVVRLDGARESERERRAEYQTKKITEEPRAPT